MAPRWVATTNLAVDGEEQRPGEGDIEGFRNQCLHNDAPPAAVDETLEHLITTSRTFDET